MRSKNVLWLGVLFIILLTVFCIAKYLNNFNPDVKTISIPNQEIIDQNFELQPVKIADVTEENYSEEVDSSYLNVIKLVEQEEKDIEDNYNKALIEEKQKSLKTQQLKKSLKTKVAHKIKKPTKKRESAKKSKKLFIETILANQTIVGFGKLSYVEKQKLKKIVNDFKVHPSSYLRIEADKRSNKFYSTKRYLAKLGVSQKDIQVLHKRYKNAILISPNHSEIEISVIELSD